ncbi:MULTISPECIES: hypothetical protein [unclassified Burkholderia]|uniref:hypothetical protein n=1 Tax=unclassified Burkholderia TaxID=2613784 RepID=UPI000F55A449|nr:MULTISPECIES: hypothetical protein [unclassified Burkholderia]RQS03562.1 hypothetical protein DIE02_19805 [Burkholderia sp. Bp8991]RQS27734.1 hypothetical protein DIE05_16850 [Burkholderia sp. Bp8995]RQS45884.1 hypothetical protein DIE00_17405 [Burkholderia sp. Bp8989]
MKRAAWRTAAALLLAGGAYVAVVLPRPAAAGQDAPAEAAHRRSPYVPVSLPREAKAYYQMGKGIDDLHVRSTASGNLIRFSYRVVDPDKARLLADTKSTVYLYGETSHAMLVIPVMDQIGALRQTGQLIAGQEYWMVFSNKGGPIKRGERVSILIDSLHIDGLVVE